ncbi:receptor-like protein EIX2 [Jatropha curcas]|uniref:receptor-like protein EIX2 n=1 Tax=Jatropha curcas TaxID=180498 RepID=UPI001894D484|nr:receptor-like protein EIX2 [Jatropha curcas]
MHLQPFSVFVALLLFLMHFLIASAVRNDSVLCKEREREALLSIKRGLIDHDGRLSSWGSEEDKRDCCKWTGITCSNRTGHVTELYLMRMDLGSKMSHSLLDLRHLTSLDLSVNDFGGTQFPIDKNGSLTKLRYLDLANANFGGTMSSVLRNLSSLQFLDLRYNHFIDIGNSDWVSGLSSLTTLDLTRIPLVNPNHWLQIVNNYKLLHLQTLRLESCFSGDEINTLPLSPINSSSALTEISLFDNNFVIPSDNNFVIPSIYPWLSNISQNIQFLDLSSNILYGSALADFDKMISLPYINLSNTTIGGYIPKSFGNMSQLSVLHLSHNKFNMKLFDLIQNLSGFTERSLETLSLDHNQIGGSLPDLARFSSLRNLFLGNNHLNGTISKSIGCLSQLEQFDINSNSLSGVISEHHFSNMSKLFLLDLSGNSLILNISVNWVPPSSLRCIFLASCKIGPHFPKWLHSLNTYFALDISNAGISDFVPNWFWGFSSVSSYLNLSNNLFSGVIPRDFMNMQNLVFLNLANNNLSSKIPFSIGFLFKLQTLNLKNNKFSGELPFSLRNCTNLKFIDLSGNKLSSNVPIWFGKSSSSLQYPLQYLSLRSNQFSGSMPLQLCQLTNVQILDLSINNINGTIPNCLNNLRAMIDENSNETILHDYGWLIQLGVSKIVSTYNDEALVLWKGSEYILDKNLGRFRIIDLSSNKIEGEIPREIAILSSLRQLNLSNNKLSGAIPKEIDGLKQLESLDLSQNQLSGRLPASISNLNFLNTLNLSHNNFLGKIPSGTQLQTFNASTYSNNPALCGSPLPQKCPEDNIQDSPSSHDDHDNQEDEFNKSLYLGMGVGFAVGFWGVSGVLLLKRSYRHAFFKFVDDLKDWIYVRTVIYMKKLQQIKVRFSLTLPV